MKKFLLVASIFATSFVFANNVEVNKNNKAPQKEVRNTEFSEIVKSEDALYCKVVTKDGDKFSCWLCDCDELKDLVRKIDEER